MKSAKMKSAKEVLQEIANNPEIEPQQRINAATSLSQIERQDKFDEMASPFDAPPADVEELRKEVMHLQGDVQHLNQILSPLLGDTEDE